MNTLLTVAIVVGFNQWLRIQLIAEADNALLGNAHQIADRIDEFNRSNKQVFNIGATLPGLIDFLQANEEERHDVDFRDRTRIILDSLEIEPWDEYYVLSQALLDASGQNILDTDQNNVGADESNQDYFRAALSGGSVNISAIQYRPERGGIYFYYAVPLRESDAPRSVLGVLRVQIAIASIQDIVFDSARGQDFSIAIFDENFVRVVDTQHEELLFRSITTLSAEQIAALRSQYALPPLPDADVSVPVPTLVDTLSDTHQENVVSGYIAPHSEDEERLAIVRLETVPWFLVMSQPSELYYQPVQQQSRGILVLVLTLTVIALVSSYLIASRITKPIRALTTVASQVAEGALYVKAPITSSDEVGTLARTFNLMTSELEIARTTLEERVNKRTQELSETNEKLKHEIAERKRYETQALELALEHERRRILSEFIQKASHEFRTPLTIINTKSYIARQFLPNERHRHLQVIEEQSKYIEGLVNRMVLMARLDSNISSASKDLPVDDFVRTVHSSRADVYDEKKAVIHLDLQAGNTWIHANPELLFTAIQNILENALKHSEDQTEVTIRTCTQDETVSIIIEDNGIGIPEEMQDRVFERFFRVDKAHTTRGFGLGLPIAKRIVENVGGTLELESTVGKGTKVTIKLGVKKRKRA